MATHYTIRGGIDSSAVYREETTYGATGATGSTGYAHFGVTQSVRPSINRNLVKVRGMAGSLPAANTTITARDAVSILAGKSELSVDIAYQPQDWSFLKYVMGSSSVVGTTYNYPQATASTESDKRKYLTIPSFSILERFDYGGSDDSADTAFKFTGLKVNNFEIKGAIGEPISCSVSTIGSNILYDQTSVDTTYPYIALSSEDVFHFIGSEISIGATAIANLIDGFTLTINHNAQGHGDIRSYVNEAVTVHQRDITLKIDMKHENITYIKSMLGAGTGVTTPTEIAAITLEIEKTTGKKLTINLSNLKINDAFPETSYGEVMTESITLEAKLCYFVETRAAE